MTHAIRAAVLFLAASVGFALGVECATPQVTRYSFTYGPSSMTADLLRSH